MDHSESPIHQTRAEPRVTEPRTTPVAAVTTRAATTREVTTTKRWLRADV